MVCVRKIKVTQWFVYRRSKLLSGLCMTAKNRIPWFHSCLKPFRITIFEVSISFSELHFKHIFDFKQVLNVKQRSLTHQQLGTPGTAAFPYRDLDWYYGAYYVLIIPLKKGMFFTQSLCLSVCHHVCGEMVGHSNMVSSEVNTIYKNLKMQHQSL